MHRRIERGPMHHACSDRAGAAPGARDGRPQSGAFEPPPQT